MSEEERKLIDVKYLRMNFNERIQHFLLFSSFIILILTGFGLKFPESFWVQWIVYIIGENAFEARGIVHRIASVVMIAASVYHLYYILFTPAGKKLIKDFLPVKQDIVDFRDSMLYLVGKSDIKPLMGRFSYIEKMEYWAVVWGTFIMGGTGMVLWFENYFLKYVGTMGMDVATAIHYYEAILASLAILVWHFYFIFLNPDVFPMNKAWFKGYLTREQMEHEHPLELMELEGTDETEENEEIVNSADNNISDGEGITEMENVEKSADLKKKDEGSYKDEDNIDKTSSKIDEKNDGKC